jgi:molybdenum cofactor guanylyltransferase
MAVSGAVLAGGSSRRMGTDKRHVTIDGVPLLVRAVEAVRAVADEVLIVGGPATTAGESDAVTRAIGDLRPGEGPLAGIEAALDAARHPWVLVVAVDHPWLSPAVLGLLLDRLRRTDAQAVLLGTERGPQPLVGAYRRTARTAVSALLDTGERRATRLPEALGAVVVGPDEWLPLDEAGATAHDVDTPADLPDTPTRG